MNNFITSALSHFFIFSFFVVFQKQNLLLAIAKKDADGIIPYFVECIEEREDLLTFDELSDYNDNEEVCENSCLLFHSFEFLFPNNNKPSSMISTQFYISQQLRITKY